MSLSHPVTLNLLTSAWTTLDRSVLNGHDLHRVGTVFGRTAAVSVWDEAQSSTAHSVDEVEGGYVTPICQDDSYTVQGAKATIVLESLESKL